MTDKKIIEKDDIYFSKIINIGFYLSFLNMFIFGLLFFSLTQMFLDPLNNSLWLGLSCVWTFFFIVSLVTIFIFLTKIIINNTLFIKIEEKKQKNYFISAIALFIFNSAISFLMFKKILKNKIEY